MSDDFFDLGSGDSGYDPNTGIDSNATGGFDTIGDTTNLATGDGHIGMENIPVDENAAVNDMLAPGTSDAPTASDIQSLRDQGYTDQQIAQVLGNVAAEKPEWASVLTKLLPAGISALPKSNLTSQMLKPGTTTGLGGSTAPGGSPLGTTDPMGLLAAAGLAYQQFHNADQYTKQADKYGKELNPYGAYRDAAAQKLAALQADPSSIVDTPGYKFNLSQGLGAVANRDNRSYGVGAGSTNPDMMNFASGLASKTYNDTIKQYSDQAGVGIGPSAAASIYGLGMQGNIASQNNAINALMSPFGPGNNTGGGGGGGINWDTIKSWFGGNTAPVVNGTTPAPTTPTDGSVGIN